VTTIYSDGVLLRFLTKDNTFSAEKQKAPAPVQEELGVVCDFSLPHSDQVYSVAPQDEGCEWILCDSELERCRITNRITPGNAKSIKGKLSFLLQSLSGRIGRAMALPLILRCHESHGITHFSLELKDLQCFLNIIRVLEEGIRPS